MEHAQLRALIIATLVAGAQDWTLSTIDSATRIADVILKETGA